MCLLWRLCSCLTLYCCGWDLWSAAPKRHLFHHWWWSRSLHWEKPVRHVRICQSAVTAQPGKAHWLKQFHPNPKWRWRFVSVKNISNDPVLSSAEFQWGFFSFFSWKICPACRISLGSENPVKLSPLHPFSLFKMLAQLYVALERYLYWCTKGVESTSFTGLLILQSTELCRTVVVPGQIGTRKSLSSYSE